MALNYILKINGFHEWCHIAFNCLFEYTKFDLNNQILKIIAKYCDLTKCIPRNCGFILATEFMDSLYVQFYNKRCNINIANFLA